MSKLVSELLDLLPEQVVGPAPPLVEPEKVNKQLYHNSPLAGSPIEERAKTEGFFGAKSPNLAILSERPIHRVIMYMKAEGKTNREVAKATGQSEGWVSQITRQPWFQTQLLDFIKEQCETPVQNFLAAQLEPTILRLVELRDQNVSLPVALGATTNLLDRYLGKPVQRTEAKIEHVQTAEKKFDSIEAELAALKEEEQRILSQRQPAPAVNDGSGRGDEVAGLDAVPSPASPGIEMPSVEEVLA